LIFSIFSKFFITEGNFYEGEEGLDHLTEEGQANLQHLENLIGQGDGQNPLNNRKYILRDLERMENNKRKSYHTPLSVTHDWL
jgi:hypothetical protein